MRGSAVYAHLWSTPEVEALLGDEGRLASWLDILAALARAQGELGLIPAEAADEITPGSDGASLDDPVVSASGAGAPTSPAPSSPAPSATAPSAARTDSAAEPVADTPRDANGTSRP